MHQKKAMSMALTLVISIVVLIVVSLAVIAITTGNLATTGQNTGQTTTSTFEKINTLNDQNYNGGSADSNTNNACIRPDSTGACPGGGAVSSITGCCT